MSILKAEKQHTIFGIALFFSDSGASAVILEDLFIVLNDRYCWHAHSGAGAEFLFTSLQIYRTLLHYD